MATAQSRRLARWMSMPAIIVLLLWMVVPLAMTLYFSFRRYNLNYPDRQGWAGWNNYYYFLTDPAFAAAFQNTLVLVIGVLIITVVGGILLALLLDQPFWGQGIVRVLVIAPFFVMPTVSALVWKNMFMNPVNGLFAHAAQAVGLQPIDFLGHHPLSSIVGIVAWAWLPFATLILLTALQSLDREQIEASEMDGAGFGARFFYIILPHMTRSITVVILIQTIFLLGIYAEILVTTNGGPGTQSMNLPYLIAVTTTQQDVGGAAAGGVIAIILANIVAIFLMRMIGKNLES
ncbi:carbohydrate ABC transporter permease [Frigidibacter sp. ROC022]|uniref:carbohydrate ABC transporter permease n=1 Tax=Frigidibacter sp. ROC022 TaxID=2971796 RepID=UPI00215ABB34|nr:sugar ABC transporter permease [Frigidibacter sp. ROC022]MCR8726449.1 sugar ABC transporter permease [Frigidibacter sp. ROC022]